MMNEQIFTAIFWSDKTETFVCVEPLYCTFTHNIYLQNFGELKNHLAIAFTVSMQVLLNYQGLK